MTDLTAHGVSVAVPVGWEGRVFRRPAEGEVGASAADGPPAPAGETTNVVVHLSTIVLPAETADFASNAVERLGPDDALVVLFEYDAASVAQPLFSSVGLPAALTTADFSLGVLQRTIRGQAGAQVFFQQSGRAFCLYVVLGSFRNRHSLVPAVNSVLASFEIGLVPGSAPPPHTILEIVDGQGDLTTLAELLRVPAARDLVDGGGPVTLFAPDDDAFAMIDVAALRGDPDRLVRTIAHHLAARAISIEALARLQAVTPMEGDALVIQVVQGGRVLVDGVPVVRPDLDATNGVVHVITGVLELPR